MADPDGDTSVLEASMANGARNANAGQDAAEMMREYCPRLPADHFPNLTALADTTFADDADALFEFGVDLLMRGLAAYKESPAFHPR